MLLLMFGYSMAYESISVMPEFFIMFVFALAFSIAIFIEMIWIISLHHKTAKWKQSDKQEERWSWKKEEGE